jgi:hypothetical protein
VKSPKTIALLLLLNLGLFTAILGYVLRARITAPLFWSEPGTDVSAGAHRSAATSVPGKVVVLVTNQLQWAQLESEEYPTYIARLRSIGCPEQTIRDIIIADLDKMLAPEIQAASGRRQELKYWHPEEEEMLNDVNPHELFLKERQIDKRKRAIIRELIHADLARERMKASGQEDYYERRLNFLPEERRTQVRETLEKYDEAEQKIRDQESEDDATIAATERGQVRVLRQAREAEIDGLLTAEEKQQYELWLSPTANEVRHALYGMNASEEEFLTIYQARKAFDEAWGARDPDALDAAGREQMERARAEMEDRILQGLGERRYAEYQRGQDDDFHLVSALVTRFRLPKEKAAEVYGYKTVALAYRAQVRDDSNLSPQQKEEALKSISEETKNAVRGVLGVKAYNYYLRTGQGRWIGE